MRHINVKHTLIEMRGIICQHRYAPTYLYNTVTNVRVVN